MKGYLDAKELESYKKEDLQELAKQLGVDAEGTKKEIAARCAAVEVDIPDDNELTEEDKKAAAEAAAEAAAKAEEEKAAAEAAPFLLTMPTEKMARSSSFTFLPSRISSLVQEIMSVSTPLISPSE